MDHPDAWDDRGTVCVVDLSGKKTTLSQMWTAEEGLAWSAKGDEIWFTATATGTSNRKLMAVTLSGKMRTVLNIPGGLNLQDIASDGRVLLTIDRERLAMEWSAGQNQVTQDITWYDWSVVRDVSRDGQWVLFEEGSEPVEKIMLLVFAKQMARRRSGLVTAQLEDYLQMENGPSRCLLVRLNM